MGQPWTIDSMRAEDRDAVQADADSGSPANSQFKLDNYPFYLISRIDHYYGSAMSQILANHGMERTQWQILLILRERNPSSISELAERSGKKLSTVSRMIERMRAESLVSTFPRKSDNRITEVQLNDSGFAALDKVIEIAARQYQRAILGLSNEEIESFTRQLQNILVNLERSPYE